jgi:integrase
VAQSPEEGAGVQGQPARGRRANSEGSITRRADGRWMGRVRLRDGTRRAVYGRNHAEVAAKLRETVAIADRGLPQPSGTETVESFLAAWLESSRNRLRPSTWGAYERHLRRHVLPTLGRQRLAKLLPLDLDRLYQHLLAGGLSPSSVHHIHAILHKALGQAMRWDLVGRNVADLVDPPRMRRIPMRALSPEEARRFLEAARGDPLEALYVLAITTGMRRGELLALRWRDVDVQGATLSVTGTLQRVGDRLEIREPKTGSSRRSIELTAQAVEALDGHRAAQVRQRLTAGERWRDHDLVFCTEVGTPIEAGNLLRRSFWPLVRRAGLGHLRFHDLRHTAATLMLAGGVHPKVASEMLGHSTVAITLNLYSHVTRTMGRQAATTMEEILGR